MGLTAEQVERFREQGFVNAGRVLTPAELAEITREYDRLVTFEAQTLGDPDEGVFPYRAMLNFRSPALRRYLTHPALVGIAMDLLGPDVRFWWDQGINKAPGSGSRIPWHQDNGYHRGSVPEYVTAWLAVDDSDTQNGGLQVVPGSHRGGGLRPHVMRGVHACIPDVDESAAVPLDARAGDLLVFSSLLVHQTVGNHTADRPRRAWVLQFARADAVNAETGERYDDRAWVARDGRVLDEPWSERPFDLRGRASERA